MKKLNEKGFAISSILYTMLVLVVLLMFLIINILANSKATNNKLTGSVKKKVDETKYSSVNGGGVVEPPTLLLYSVLENNVISPDTNINFLKMTPSTGAANYPIVNVDGNGIYQVAKTEYSSVPLYYYRGAVENNYVLFGGYCWKMVRTTYAKGVKMVYSGEALNGKCTATQNQFVALKAKYSTNTTSPSTNYSSSNAKVQVDSFYNTLKTKVPNLDNKLENMVLCNDTNANAWNRILTGAPVVNTCNSSYNYKVGLLSADEVMYVGGIATGEKVRINYYLRIDQPTIYDRNNYGVTYLNINSVTMSGSSETQISYVGGEGQLSTYGAAAVQYGIRPVITLKEGTLYTDASQDGTANNPYVVE